MLKEHIEKRVNEIANGTLPRQIKIIQLFAMTMIDSDRYGAHSALIAITQRDPELREALFYLIGVASTGKSVDWRRELK